MRKQKKIRQNRCQVAKIKAQAMSKRRQWRQFSTTGVCIRVFRVVLIIKLKTRVTTLCFWYIENVRYMQDRKKTDTCFFEK